jgi:glycosyltransferase involved in cell wall biosynthesis
MVRAAIERQIDECGLRQSVILTGKVDYQTIPEYLSAADICVALYPELPAEMWFSPLKLFEYMAAGKAIVASRVGQVAEVIEHNRSGMLADVGDIGGTAELIVSLLKDADKCRLLGMNAYQQALARHSWQRYAEGLENIYEAALARYSASR